MPALTLYEFPVSHYCEKVRWALDFKRLPYQSKSMVPVLHLPTMLALTRQTQVPVLKLDGKLVQNSPRILARLEERFPNAPSLYPKDSEERARALELADFWDKELGPHVRRTAYFHALPDKRFIYQLLSEGHGTINKALLKATQPLIMRAMRAGMNITPKGYAKSLARLQTALDRLDGSIQPNGYLVGEDFSVADLTAASLLAPLALPENSLYAKPSDPPAALQAFCDELEARPSLAWVREIYRRHR